jgi:hypothetical protein
MNSTIYSDIGKEVRDYNTYLPVDEIDQSTLEISRTYPNIILSCNWKG